MRLKLDLVKENLNQSLKNKIQPQIGIYQKMEEITIGRLPRTLNTHILL